MSDFKNSLQYSISNYQYYLLDEANRFVGNWLSEQDDFEAAVEWLFSSESNVVFENSEGTFAFDLVAYALEAYGNWLEENEPLSELDDDDIEDQRKEEAETKPDRTEFYEKVRNYFGC